LSEILHSLQLAAQNDPIHINTKEFSSALLMAATMSKAKHNSKLSKIFMPVDGVMPWLLALHSWGHHF
jgi:hypothetical protein